MSVHWPLKGVLRNSHPVFPWASADPGQIYLSLGQQGRLVASLTTLKQSPRGAWLLFKHHHDAVTIFGSKTPEAALAGNHAFEHDHPFSPAASRLSFQDQGYSKIWISSKLC